MTGFDREPRREENRHQRTGRNTDRHRDTSPTGSPQRYISIGAAAEYASVSKDTIRRMIADGTLPAYRFRGQVRIAIEDVENAMRPIQ